MYIDFQQAAAVLDVHHSTVRRWARKADLNVKADRGRREKLPFRALLNYLYREEKFPFGKIEPGAVKEKTE